MSGKPNEPQIAELMECLKVLADSRERSLVIEKLVAEQQELGRKAESARRKVLKLIEEMDLKSSGNTGYEGRTCWFLTELYRQITQDVSQAVALGAIENNPPERQGEPVGDE